jgi:hypothetical protein
MQRQAWLNAATTITLLVLTTYSVVAQFSVVQVLGLGLLAVLAAKDLVEVEVAGPVRIRGRFQPQVVSETSTTRARTRARISKGDAGGAAN